MMWGDIAAVSVSCGFTGLVLGDNLGVGYGGEEGRGAEKVHNLSPSSLHQLPATVSTISNVLNSTDSTVFKAHKAKRNIG